MIEQQLIDAAKSLYAKNMLAGADGNISARLDEHIIITPSGVAKSSLKPADFARVKLDGTVVSGKPSSELAMHLAVYQARADVSVVIHAHPPKAIAYTIAYPQRQEFEVGAMSELILSIGSLPIVAYARPGTEQMADNIRSYLAKHKAMVLARHGALTCGANVAEALRGMERIEHTAEILLAAHQFGGITTLPETEITYLRQCKAKLGDTIL